MQYTLLWCLCHICEIEVSVLGVRTKTPYVISHHEGRNVLIQKGREEGNWECIGICEVGKWQGKSEKGRMQRRVCYSCKGRKRSFKSENKCWMVWPKVLSTTDTGLSCSWVNVDVQVIHIVVWEIYLSLNQLDTCCQNKEIKSQSGWVFIAPICFRNMSTWRLLWP